MKFKFLPIIFLLLSACSDSAKSIYGNIPTNEDGVVDVSLNEDDISLEKVSERNWTNEIIKADDLSTPEINIVKTYHRGQFSRFSFIIVDAENNKVVRSYLAETPRKLASVTKVSTALASLETIPKINVNAIKSMLKSSLNNVASKYVRLSAKSINNYTTNKKSYNEQHSCPSAFKNDQKAAEIVFEWITLQLNDVDWSNASLKDGAGCDYENKMSAYQLTKIFQYADSMGPIYNGQSFEQLLSISGTDGTWAKYNKDTKGRILAKTGTLSPASNLAGYFYAKKQNKLKKYYFAILVEKDAGTENTNKARRFIEALMRNWIFFYSEHDAQFLATF